MNRSIFWNGVITMQAAIIILIIVMIGIKYGKNQINERRISNVVNEFCNVLHDENIQNLNNVRIDDYVVIGVITISKINLKYPILDKTDDKGMKLSITKFYGEELNEIGNVTLVGHNNRDGTMFGKIKYLERGDVIQIMDQKNRIVNYEIFDYGIIDPNDISCVEAEYENTKELTLITCSNGNRKRLVIKAREST